MLTMNEKRYLEQLANIRALAEKLHRQRARLAHITEIITEMNQLTEVVTSGNATQATVDRVSTLMEEVKQIMAEHEFDEMKPRGVQ